MSNITVTDTATPTNPNVIRLKISVWGEHLTEAKTGTVNTTLTLDEIRAQLDWWLDRYIEQIPELGPCMIVEGETTCRACGQNFALKVTL